MAQMVLKHPPKACSLCSTTNNALQRANGCPDGKRLETRHIYVPFIENLEWNHKIARQYSLVQYLRILGPVETFKFVKVSSILLVWIYSVTVDI
jgi:hypothetical protein